MPASLLEKLLDAFLPRGLLGLDGRHWMCVSGGCSHLVTARVNAARVLARRIELELASTGEADNIARSR